MSEQKISLITAIKEAWGWLGVAPSQVLGENEFGNLIIEDTEGRYWRLCPEDVYCEIIANDRDELSLLFSDQEFLEDWHMQALVDLAYRNLGPLSGGRKYTLIIPGVLGGEYVTSNIKMVELEEMVRFSGDLARQIDELPDGEQIQFKFVD